MSRVFVAEELALGRRVVVKVLPPDLAATVNVERFEREIRVSAALQHPGIVPLIAAGSADELLWFTMPFVEGDSLRARISNEGPLPIGDAVRIWCDMLEALDYAHGRGVVHRDIKPDNVLLSGRRSLIADFGVARAISTATDAQRFTGTGLSLGTPAYMSPEQAAGDVNADQRADIYAAGLVMYEMLVGKGPFADRSPVQQMSAHVTQPPPPVREQRPQVSPALAKLVHQCLEKRPEDRPAHAGELVRALELIPDVTPAARNVTKKRSKWRWVIGAVVAVAFIGAAFAGVQVQRMRAAMPLPDSLRMMVALLPMTREPADSLLARGLSQRVAATLSSDRRLDVGPLEEMLSDLANLVGASAQDVLRDSVSAWMPDLGVQVRVSTGLARAGTEFLFSVQVRTMSNDSLLYSEQVGAKDADELASAASRIAAETRKVLIPFAGQLPAPTPTGVFFRTSSDAALLFRDGNRAFQNRDYLTAADHFRAAVRVDSTFASAWESLALGNAGVNVDERTRARAAAFRHRQQLRILPEQLGLEAEYYRMVGDPARAVSVFERMEREYGPGGSRTNGLGLTYAALGRFDDALRAFDRVRDTTYRRPWFANQNYVASLIDLGRLDDAKREVRLLDSIAGPDVSSTRVARYHVLRAERQYDSVAHYARRELERARSDAERLSAGATLRLTLMTLGLLLDADRIQGERQETMVRASADGASLTSTLDHLYTWMHLTGDTTEARRRLAAAMQTTPWRSLAPMDRPYIAAVRVYGTIGQPERARELAAEWAREVPDEFQPASARGIANSLGEVELRAGRAREALVLFRRAETPSCPQCFSPEYARTWDALGNADSALHWYTVYLESKSQRQAANDALFLAASFRRAAELHEARGESAKAIERYTGLLDLWRNADPSLQPVLLDVQQRISALRARSR
jgi:tetratricopeptide (TPR) repeat protein